MSFVATLIQSTDQLLEHYVFNGYQAVVSLFAATVISLLVIYFAGLGWLVIRGLIPLTPMAVAWHMLTAAFIVALALNWSYFSYFFVSFFTHGMDRLIGGVLASANDQATDIRTVTAGLDKIWQNGTNLFADVWRASGPSFFLGNLMGFLGFAIVVGVTAVPLFYILMAKIALAVLLILAPVIMPLFLWEATREIFNGWLRLLTQWMITPLLIYIFISLYLKLFLTQIAQMSTAPAGPTTASISAFVLLGVIMMATFKQANNMSRDLAQKITLKKFGGSHSFDVPAKAFKALREGKSD